MELLVLYESNYKVTGISLNGECDAINTLLNFSTKGQYKGSVDGLVVILDRVSKDGLNNLSSKLTHSVDPNGLIYEFVKGDIRLFYFKGNNNCIVVCTSAAIKKTQKADKHHVNKAMKYRDEYFKSLKDGSLTVVEDN